MHCDILIRNCSLLTPEYDVRESVSVAIDGSYIAFIGNAGKSESRGAEFEAAWAATGS